MAKLSTKGLFAVALLFSLLAAVLVYSYLQTLSVQNDKPGLPVVVAKTAIQPKTRLTGEMLQLVTVPAEYIQPGALQDISKAVGIIAREQIMAGEQVTERRLLLDGKSAGFTGIIPPDKRAVSVAVSDVTGVAGLVRPGDYVDVIVTFDTNILGQHLSQICLQNLMVLATNRETEMNVADNVKKEGGGKMTVTLAVSPDDATKLTVAEEKGKIRLALRPYLPSDTLVATYPLKPRDIVSVPAEPPPVAGSPAGPPAVAPAAPAPPAAPVAPPRGIQLIRGTKTEFIPVH